MVVLVVQKNVSFLCQVFSQNNDINIFLKEKYLDVKLCFTGNDFTKKSELKLIIIKNNLIHLQTFKMQFIFLDKQ